MHTVYEFVSVVHSVTLVFKNKLLRARFQFQDWRLMLFEFHLPYYALLILRILH